MYRYDEYPQRFGCSGNKKFYPSLTVFFHSLFQNTFHTPRHSSSHFMISAEPSSSPSSWPWLKGCGLTIADPPMPPVNEYDDRPLVKDLIVSHRKYIDEVHQELKSDPLYESNKHDDLWVLGHLHRFLFLDENC